MMKLRQIPQADAQCKKAVGITGTVAGMVKRKIEWKPGMKVKADCCQDVDRFPMIFWEQICLVK